MKDSGTKLRAAYHTALNGNLSVSATNVPVYYGKVESAIDEPIYVLIEEASNQDKSSKSHFATETTLAINIIQKQPSAVSMEDVEDVADQILEIVKPTPKTLGVTIASPFKILFIKLDTNDNNRPIQQPDSKFVVSKSLRLRNHIIQ